LAVLEAAVALASAMCVTREDIMPDIVLTRNQLEVHQPRNQWEIGPEPQGVSLC